MTEVIKILNNIITNVLTALYRPCGFSLLLSFFSMFFYLYAYRPINVGKGWKAAIIVWHDTFKESALFRKLFLLCFVTSLILFKTLLNRDLWMNPLSNVMGGWSIWETVNGKKKLTTECIENVIMMMPFSATLIWTFGERQRMIWKGIKITFCFSVSIEFLQLFLRLGTFQLSDIFYNTLGGCLGSVIYGGCWKMIGKQQWFSPIRLLVEEVKKRMKGIILAGGSGTRLYPLTKVTSKQLLPIYDKPMIYYPMSVLMNAGIRDILIISTPQDTPRFENLLGDGHQFGVNLTYAVQPSPDGLAQAFIIGADFIGNDSVAMVLGDNIFAGHGLKKRLNAAVEKAENGKGATVFGYYVDDPERFGIVEFDKNGKAISIEEKPEHPKSNYCVTGLYFYDNRVVEFAKNLKLSARGELEITDLNRMYLEDGTLNVELLGQGFTWLDTGTHESLVNATNFVKTVEQHQHRKIACLEEIAYLNGWISKDELMEVYEVMKKNQDGQYLKDVMDGKYQEHLY